VSEADSAAWPRSGAAPQRPWVSHWLPVVAWTALILSSSSDSFASEETSRWVTWLVSCVYPGADPVIAWALDEILRKLAHIGEFAVLGGLLLRAVRTTDAAAPVVVAFATAGAIALGDEARQWFTALRSASLLDSALDAGGSAAGIALWQRVTHVAKPTGGAER